MNRRLSTLLILALLLGLLATAQPALAQEDGELLPAALADLVIEEVSFAEGLPVAGEERTIEVTFANVGTVGSTGGPIKVDLYFSEAAPPPISTAGFPLAQIPSLPAGGSSFAGTTHTYATVNCSHKLYVRIDRENLVTEEDESNNLLALDLCAAPTCAPDGFEADNSCSAARWLQEGSTQRRTLCAPAPGDQDWVKFTGFAGVAYTVSAGKPPTSTASTRVTVFPSCSGAALTGPAATQASFTPAHSGVYYARIENSAPTTDPAAAYDLLLSSNTGVTDAYEPDDSCDLAREIPTDGVKQQRRFNRANDEDWVRFSVQAGQSFIVVADTPGPGVSPVITLATSCAQAAANQPAAEVDAAQGDGATATVSGSSSVTQIYYARVRNSNGAVFGQDKTYALRVGATACAADAFEQDDDSAAAKALALGAAQPGRTSCPPGDEDWLRFQLTAGKTYVLETSALGADSDTVIELYNEAGTLLGTNDDFGYTNGSRLAFQTTAAGSYRARVRQANPAASGATTAYAVGVREGYCLPDALEADGGDNGPGDAAPLSPNATPQPGSFCADPLDASLGDQDWTSFSAVPGGVYEVETSNLAPNSDTVVEIYDAAGQLLASNDDSGDGRSTVARYTMPGAEVSGAAPQPLYVRVRAFNSGVNGAQTNYELALSANEPPPPTPTPTPTPIPPAPTPTPNPASARTLFVVNKARLAAIYGAPAAENVMAKLFQAADDPAVQGAVIQVESAPAVAAAYAAWSADAASLADQELANAVAAAVRARLMSFLIGSSVAERVVIVGDDRIVPFYRVPDVVPASAAGVSVEPNYAGDVSANATVRAALAAGMVLTDDYYVDKEPGSWTDKQHNEHELYLPDFAISRLVEQPGEIIGSINQALGDDTIEVTNGQVLVTGYDFVQDGANLIKTLFESDQVDATTLIAPFWQAGNLRTLHINSATAWPITAINGHSTHRALKAADGGSIGAGEIITGTTPFAGTLVFSVGCHAGLPDPALLDLPQAYLRRRATYIANTGFGWGGGGVVYTEAIMRNLARELLRDLSSEVGDALVAAKLKYYSKATVFNAFDAKVLMQTTLYGLPWMRVTSGGSLTGEEEFPDAGESITPPSSFGEMAQGRFGYQLTGSFGSTEGGDGIAYDLNDRTHFEPGQPVQPAYNAPESFAAFGEAVGTLRGAVFLGGRYQQQASIDAVIALAENEYILDRSEPEFAGPDAWSPALPFAVRNGDAISATIDSLALSLGQFNPGDAGVSSASVAADTGAQRLYEQMSFATFYSFSADELPAAIGFVDGVLNPQTGKATVKVEAQDPSGVTKVLATFTTPPAAGGTASWQSVELSYDAGAAIWTGQITATQATAFFVQVVDGAGNVAVDDDKGRYYPLPLPLPLVEGAGFPNAERKVYLPTVQR